MISLHPITRDDYVFLLELLKERDPKINISHKKTPTWLEHKAFVDSNPYKKWNIVKLDNLSVGSLYITRSNEVGIFIKKEWQGQGIGSAALNIILKENIGEAYLANIAPTNPESMDFFRKHGFRLIQCTMKYDPNATAHHCPKDRYGSGGHDYDARGKCIRCNYMENA